MVQTLPVSSLYFLASIALSTILEEASEPIERDLFNSLNPLTMAGRLGKEHRVSDIFKRYRSGSAPGNSVQTADDDESGPSGAYRRIREAEILAAIDRLPALPLVANLPPWAMKGVMPELWMNSLAKIWLSPGGF